MLRILPHRHPLPLPLHGVQRSRQLEQAAAHGLPPQALMARAASAVLRLGRAWQPHARQVWIACGPGNNGGDGAWAAALWQRHLQATGGGQVWVTRVGDPAQCPADAQAAWALALASGVRLCSAAPANADLWVDALFGLGIRSAPSGLSAQLQQALLDTPLPVLCVDLPSGLDGDSGHWFGPGDGTPRGPRLTLSLLTLKPGLFMAQGRNASGELWFDDLGVVGDAPDAWLHAPAPPAPRRLGHGGHKGQHGDVVVLGGQTLAAGHAMTGAALLAARAALHGGAGRVLVGLLGDDGPMLDAAAPELMFRPAPALLAAPVLAAAAVVCGCGGGQAVQAILPTVLALAPRLVLDADALNAIAATPACQAALRARADRGWLTVLTPHPLEAARLLGLAGAAEVQQQRLAAAQALANRTRCVVVLKGSGTVVCAPGPQAPSINATGNDLLGSAGTGDVLAGWIGAALCRPGLAGPQQLAQACADVVYAHGRLADGWPDGTPLSASQLAALAHP